ncbi:MAG: hypothetical protein DWB42_21430, partial [Chloroflexi bacterium]|nr:hypothetical protein [Chloroflexota bacterium]
SYPGNPLCPPTENVEAVAAEYIRAVDAGASITHIHGVHTLERDIQADGRRLSQTNFEGWKALQEKIKAGCDPIMQFGIASARFDEKVRLMGLKPDMMAIAFNAHDEFFQPDLRFPAKEMYASHPRDELVAYSDRILVFYAGRVFEIPDASRASIDELGRLIGGHFDGASEA